MNKNRVEALSDGVFAIVITLLILDIRVPDVDYSQLPAALVAILPRIFAYVISFGVIGVYWLAHHQSLQLIAKLEWFYDLAQPDLSAGGQLHAVSNRAPGPLPAPANPNRDLWDQPDRGECARNHADDCICAHTPN